ncbi:DUF3857 domain-containing protein [Flavobacterium cyclinae]|uniref:DUF3857 domain-containing protein n=1 Tax=Flavobacterium cyclinae TaxID=2895947 RepID=UPI001E579E8F|nr:DUF3857 domain-containing protein [Flavobacterium cyclinae]UGS21941.1 DUF3857 domain-containing protein [Flavobacterium cyclinae]
MNWSKLLNNSRILLLLIGFGFSSTAQNGLEDYKKQFPDFNEVVLLDYQGYDIFIENKKIKIIQNTSFESMILSENGIHNNKESFTYSELVKLIDYDAYSVVNIKGKEKKIKVSQTAEKNSSSSSVFFDDIKERQLIFPNLETGSKKVYHYKREFVDPFLLHKYMFIGGFPIKNATFEVKTDKNINIGYKIFNDPNNTIEFEKKEVKGKFVYTWTLKDVKAYKFESNSPGILHSAPHIDIYIKDYTINNTKTEVLDDIDLLHKYYQGFVTNINKKECIDLKKITEEITKDKTTEEEKIKSIFYWVKDNIKYVAFENGYEGFIPREASLVFERKFGDCKDMANIIVSMAAYANVKNVNLSWIGTREIPYSYTELATPAVDNHMIASYKKGDEYIFLDATDRETRFGLPSSFIQGKEALVNNGTTYNIVKVPVVSAINNKVDDIVKIKIQNDKLIGNGRMEFNGFNRSMTLMQIGDASGKSRFEMIKSLVLKGNNKFNLNSYTEENIGNRDLPYFVNYDFELDNYLIKVDKEVYLNPFLHKIFEKNPIQKDRITGYDFEIISFFNSEYEYEIPSNYSLKYIPKDFTLENELLKVGTTYTKGDNKITVKYTFEVKKLVIEPNDFQLWDDSIKKMKSNYSETLILIEK